MHKRIVPTSTSGSGPRKLHHLPPQISYHGRGTPLLGPILFHGHLGRNAVLHALHEWPPAAGMIYVGRDQGMSLLYIVAGRALACQPLFL